ncbi:DNA-directed RNA polymerase subunit beta [Metabacillus niabensis]|uniref:ABC-type microcin C transport system permease subunit YejE n=1 Tax=Metabacillus niabensis TaxID=324854 RepID=A0ABT9Z3D4_9BACI|nr:DNA-directed RNA polymerase subunit beta [Metabacillus niabensis]MDQ0226769.1 ABC-type microcin C transport system permease subunit YejE [Metabacillus niabensis]
MVAKETMKVTSREEMKKAKKAKKVQEGTDQKGKKRIRIRLIPIWIRVLLVLIFMVVSAIVGVIVGYAVIGDGKASDALDKSTWQHIIDLVEKE